MPSQTNQSIPFFSSSRERRLWVWVLVVLVAIYSTLGLASTLVGELRDRGLFDIAFIVAFALFGLAILTQGLKVRPGGIEVGVAIGVAAVYLVVFARMGIPERSHLFEYGVLAIFIHEALSERASHGYRVVAPALLAFVATSLFGILDECVQAMLPSRVFEWIDILFNVLAALMATVVSVTLGWARRLAIRIRNSPSQQSDDADD